MYNIVTIFMRCVEFLASMCTLSFPTLQDTCHIGYFGHWYAISLHNTLIELFVNIYNQNTIL